MNKKNILIVILIIIIIVLVAIIVTNNNKSEEKTNNPTAVMNEVIVDNLQKAMENKLDEMDNKASSSDTSKYGDLTQEEWIECINKYYRKYMESDPTDFKVFYDEDGNYCIEAICESDIEEYASDNTFTIIDAKKGLAEDISGSLISLFDEPLLIGRDGTNVAFTDNQVLGIAYVNDKNKDSTLLKYLEFPNYYDYLPTFNKKDVKGECEFLFIPIDGLVKTSIYTCKITNDGELEKDKAICENVTDAFVFCCVFNGDLPEYVVEMKYNGYETLFPLTFSGKDGTLDLTGNESEIRDLSIY